MIYDHYLTVRPWEPNFVPARARINKSCGIYGHSREVCLSKKQKQSEDVVGEGQAAPVPESDMNPDSYRNQWRTAHKPKRPKKKKESKKGPPKPTVQACSGGKPSAKQISLVEKGGDKGVRSSQNNVDVASVDHNVRSNEVVHKGKKRVEKRAREKKNGELLMLTYGEESRVDTCTEAQADVNMEEGLGVLGEKLDLGDDIALAQAQKDLLDPGEQAMVDMGHFALPLGSSVDASMNEEKCGSGAEGACNKSLLRNIKAICAGPKPKVLLLAETKSSDDSVFRPLVKWGYDSLKYVPSEGRSGGLVILWKSDSVKIDLFEISRQFIHVRCELPGREPFLLTSVYAIPHSNLRSALWSKLKGLSSSILEPRVIIGDFNDILASNERIGGSQSNLSRMWWFNDQVLNCGLSEC
ncbi:hypothetical protein K1719_006632 [Acacia pycnantha]|nr:hypothetical protein K1719_006632 [Acacia pycnantha]